MLPMLICGRYFQAMGTGSSQIRTCWRQLKRNEQLGSSHGQTFKQAKEQELSALGWWNCEWEWQGRKYSLSLHVMKDEDLTVPIILCMDFIVLTGINQNFCKAQYTLPDLTTKIGHIDTELHYNHNQNEILYTVASCYVLNHMWQICKTNVPYLFN